MRDADLLAAARAGDVRLVRELIERMEVPSSAGPPGPPDASAPVVLARPLYHVRWSLYTRNCFRSEGLTTVGDVVRRGPAGLMAIPGFGGGSLVEVIARLRSPRLPLAGWRPPDLGLVSLYWLRRTGLSHRTTVRIRDAGMRNARDLAHRTAQQLVEFCRCPRQSLGEVVHCLARWDLALDGWDEAQYAALLSAPPDGAPFRPELAEVGPDALREAVSCCRAEVVRVLLQAGVPADVEWWDGRGGWRTPAHLAAQLGHSDLIELLVSHGALRASDERGAPPEVGRRATNVGVPIPSESECAHLRRRHTQWAELTPLQTMHALDCAGCKSWFDEHNHQPCAGEPGSA